MTATSTARWANGLARATRAHAAALALGWLALSGPCAAQSSAQGLDPVRLSGFGSVGVAHVAAPAGWVYRREVSQPLNDDRTRFDLDTRLGLQVNYAPTPSFELVGQAILRRRAEAARSTDAIEWAFAAFRPHADWALRLGRVNLDVFAMSDHRAVGFAYPYARPPLEFYATLPSTLDGADVTRVWNDSTGQWRAKVFMGSSQVAFEQANKLKASGLLGGMVSRESGGLLARVSVVDVQLTYVSPELHPLLMGLDGLSALPVPPVASQAAELRSRLNLKDVKQRYGSVGVRYDGGDYVLGAEWTRVSGPIGYTAGYASLGWRLGPATVFGLVGQLERTGQPEALPSWQQTLTPLIGPVAAQQAQMLGVAAVTAINYLSPQQTTHALGMRWDLSPQLALKVQWDRIRVAANGGTLWGRATPQAARADVGTVVLDFIF